MFACLAGSLPLPPDAVPSSPEHLEAVLDLQVEAGLAPLCDAGALDRSRPLEAWHQASRVAGDRPVKAIVAGPYSGIDPTRRNAERERAMLAAAEAGNGVLRGLAAAGCAFVQVDEPGIERVGDDPTERTLFGEAHRRLIDRVDIHLSLALLGRAERAGPELLYGLPYQSYLFDLIGGPEDWRLVTRAPMERGVICGVVPASETVVVVKEAMVWAAQYAAASNRRGLDRVGLATTGSLAALSWDVAIRRIRLLGEAARIAADDTFEHLVQELDPRAMGIKSAAFGRPMTLPEGRREKRSTTR